MLPCRSRNDGGTESLRPAQLEAPPLPPPRQLLTPKRKNAPDHRQRCVYAPRDRRLESVVGIDMDLWQRFNSLHSETKQRLPLPKGAVVETTP